MLHYALRGYQLSDTACQQARITNSINKLFADYPDIAKGLLKTPSKIEAGYFSPGRTPVYYLIQNSYYEILDTVIPAIGQNEFLKLLQHDSTAFYHSLFFNQKTPAENHRIDRIVEFIRKLSAYYNEDEIVPFLDSTPKGDHIKPFQDILLSMCQYRNDHSHSLNRLQRFLSQFSPGHIDQLLLNDGDENNKIIMELSCHLSGDYYDDEVKAWYSNVFHQLDQHSTIMPTLLMQKQTKDSVPYWQAFQDKGLIDNDLKERLKMDSPEKIKGHMQSLLTAITKQSGLRPFKRGNAQQCLGDLEKINAHSDNANEDLKELFERVVIQMGKHQFWRQGNNADKARSTVNMDQLPDTLRQFYNHFDTIRQQAFDISNQQWCDLLKGDKPRLTLSNNPHSTFDLGQSSQQQQQGIHSHDYKP